MIQITEVHKPFLWQHVPVYKILVYIQKFLYLSVSTGNMVGLARANRICGIFSKLPTKIRIFDSTRPTLQKTFIMWRWETFFGSV